MNEELRIRSSSEAIRRRMPLIYNRKLRFVIISGVVCICAGLVALGVIVKRPGGLLGISVAAQFSNVSVAETASSATVLLTNESAAFRDARPKGMLPEATAVIALAPPSNVINVLTGGNAAVAPRTLSGNVAKDSATVSALRNLSDVPTTGIHITTIGSSSAKVTSSTLSTDSPETHDSTSSSESSITTAKGSERTMHSALTWSTTKNLPLSTESRSNATARTAHLAAADLGKDLLGKPLKVSVKLSTLEATQNSNTSTGSLTSTALAKTKKQTKVTTKAFSPPRYRVVRRKTETTASGVEDYVQEDYENDETEKSVH
ncbi:hypothetical protein ISCGN_012744 [Ixodes scapularis]